MKRREFFKNMAGIAGAAVIAPILLTTIKSHAEEGRRKKADAAGGSEMVDPNEATAKAVQYIEASKAAGKDCTNCILYAKTEMKNGKEVGTCALFPKKLVFGKAYCNSWAKKA